MCGVITTIIVPRIQIYSRQTGTGTKILETVYRYQYLHTHKLGVKLNYRCVAQKFQRTNVFSWSIYCFEIKFPELPITFQAVFLNSTRKMSDNLVASDVYIKESASSTLEVSDKNSLTVDNSSTKTETVGDAGETILRSESVAKSVAVNVHEEKSVSSVTRLTMKEAVGVVMNDEFAQKILILETKIEENEEEIDTQASKILELHKANRKLTLERDTANYKIIELEHVIATKAREVEHTHEQFLILKELSAKSDQRIVELEAELASKTTTVRGLARSLSDLQHDLENKEKENAEKQLLLQVAVQDKQVGVCLLCKQQRRRG